MQEDLFLSFFLFFLSLSHYPSFSLSLIFASPFERVDGKLQGNYFSFVGSNSLVSFYLFLILHFLLLFPSFQSGCFQLRRDLRLNSENEEKKHPRLVLYKASCFQIFIPIPATKKSNILNRYCQILLDCPNHKFTKKSVFLFND